MITILFWGVIYLLLGVLFALAYINQSTPNSLFSDDSIWFLLSFWLLILSAMLIMGILNTLIKWYKWARGVE